MRNVGTVSCEASSISADSRPSGGGNECTLLSGVGDNNPGVITKSSSTSSLGVLAAGVMCDGVRVDKYSAD